MKEGEIKSLSYFQHPVCWPRYGDLDSSRYSVSVPKFQFAGGSECAEVSPDAKSKHLLTPKITATNNIISLLCISHVAINCLMIGRMMIKRIFTLTC